MYKSVNRKVLYVAWFHQMFPKQKICWSVVLPSSRVCLILFLLSKCCLCTALYTVKKQGTSHTSMSHYNKFV